jgi:hypothetical protein
MQVIKRNGSKQDVSFDKVTARIAHQAAGLAGVNVLRIAQQVCAYIHNGVSTQQLDITASNICSSLIAQHPDHDTLAARLVVSNMHKETHKKFSEAMVRLGKSDKVSKELTSIVHANADLLDLLGADYEFGYLASARELPDSRRGRPSRTPHYVHAGRSASTATT